MKLEQSFEVQAPLQRVWEALIDVEQVAPCLPGASITGRNPDGSYSGEFKVRIGPTSAAYTGKLHMEDVDEAAHSATMQAAGIDKRGQGGAKATIISSVVEAAGGATTVTVDTDYQITGRLARFGRGGMIEEISNRLLGEFASSLQGMLAGSGDAPAPAPATAEEQAKAQAEAAGSATTEAVPSPEAAESPEAAASEGSEASEESETSETPPPPTSEPVPPPTPPTAGPGAPPTTGPTPPPTTESEPLDVLSLMRSVALTKVKSDPVPFVGALVGLLIALRLLRRR